MKPKNIEQVSNDTFNGFIDEFNNNLNYGNHTMIQDHRASFDIIQIDDSKKHQSVWNKNHHYADLDKFYIKESVKMLFAGERINQRVLNAVKYQLMSMDKFNAMFNRRVDIFHNGRKLPVDQMRVALFDYTIIIELPIGLINNNIKIITRPFFKDVLARGIINEIRVPVVNISMLNDPSECLVYRDGAEYHEYSISMSPDKKHHIFKLNSHCSEHVEIVFMRGLKYAGKVKLVNNHIDVASLVDKKTVVNDGNVITFNAPNGTIIDMLLESKTSTVLESQLSYSSSFSMYFIYISEKYDTSLYQDNYLWYFERYKEYFYANVNNEALMPEFMNTFELFKAPISVNDYVATEYENIIDYYKDKTYDIIDYNDELISRLYEVCLHASILGGRAHIRNSYIDLRTYDSEKNTRKNTAAEIPGNAIDFVAPMVLFKVYNPEAYIVNVYMDGIRNFVFSYQDQCSNGYTAIYIQKHYLLKYEQIEFEIISTRKRVGSAMTSNINNTTDLLIPNVTERDIFNGMIDDTMFIGFVTDSTKNSLKYLGKLDALYDKEGDSLSVKIKKPLASSEILKIVDANFVQSFCHDTRQRGENIKLTLNTFTDVPYDDKYFRVFKNGRQLPKESYTITFPDKNRNLQFPEIDIKIKYTVYELIEVEYIPIKHSRNMYTSSIQDSDGTFSIMPTNNMAPSIKRTFFNDAKNSILLNGRRITGDHKKIWCNKGLTLHNVNSTRNLEILEKDNILIDSILEPYYKYYEKAKNKFSEFVVTTMKGGPVQDIEKDCTDVNIERTGELYYDLYREYLKFNHINMNSPLPEYIGFKYNKLVDKGLNDTISVNANEEQLYFMPLDGNMKTDENLIEIMGNYYQLLEDMASVQVVDPGSIPPEILEKYGILLENNVLILQVPDLPPM